MRLFQVLLLLASSAAVVTSVADAHGADASVGTWEPISSHQLKSFFKRASFSLEPHIEKLRQRRLAEAEDPQHRRLTAEQCLADMKRLQGEYENAFPKRLTNLQSDLMGAKNGGGKLNVRDLIPKLQQIGESVRNFDFASLGKATLEGLFNGLIVVDLVQMGAEVDAMMGQARAVIDTIKQVEGVVRAIGNNVLEMLERRDFEHFINAALATSDAVFDKNINSLDKLFSACSAFDYSQGPLLAGAMDNFQLCTRETDNDQLRTCRVSVGVSAIGAMVQFISAASYCDAHVAIAQSHSSHPVSALKVDAEKLVKAVMLLLPEGARNEPNYTDVYKTIDAYAANITRFSDQAATLDDPSSSDTYVKEALADLNTHWLGSIAAIKNYTSSDVYKNMTALNPDAGVAGQIVGLALGKSQNEVMDKLGGLQKKVVDQHNERMGLYDKVNNTLWTNHAEFMGQVDHMSTLFTEQHTERMGRLQGVQGSLGNIQSSTTNGFAQLRGRIQDMGRKFVAQVQGIEQNVVSTGAETTNYLSNAVMDANREIESRINGVGDTVIRNHEKIMSAIGDAQETAVNEFGATQNLLYSASDALRQTIDNGMNAVAQTASNAFNQVNDVVYKKMEEGHTIMSQIMAGMQSDFSLVDDKLVILENRAANMSKQLEIAKEFLLDIHSQFDYIQQMLDDLPTVVQQEMFQSDVDGLHRKYQNMRKVYRDYLEADLPIKTIVESCVSFQIYDLFLQFLRLVDVSDEELPRQLENFGFDRGSYEQFGVMVIGVLNDLSFFDGVCAKAQFSATLKDLEAKAKEQADLILAATSKLAHQVEEVIPALMLANRIKRRIDQVSEIPLGSNAAQMIEDLRGEIQRGLSDFAYVTVIHAGKDGQLLIDHLDRDLATTDGKPRHSGAIVSKNQKLAVLWSQTFQVPAASLASANQTELLRRGVYRGNITSTSKSCFVAVSNDAYYPRCNQCSCVHYEDFASRTDPMAGRAVTYLSEKAYDADFAVETVFSSGMDYSLHMIQLSAGSLTPGSTATARFQAPVISPSTKQASTRTLWEGTSGSGRFDVVPSDIKGTLLSENELTLTITHGSKLLRQTFALFCDGYVKVTAVPESDLQLRYACTQVPRASAPSDLVKRGYPFMTSGLPTKRLGRAVCVENGTQKTCKVRGALDATKGDGSARLSFGPQVESVTLFTDKVFHGVFAICRDCAPATLAELTTANAFKSVVIGIPDAPAQMLSIECSETSRPTPEKLLVCRPSANAQ